MNGWVGLVGWHVADGLPTLVVTHQLQVERRRGKVRQSETDVLPLCYATNHEFVANLPLSLSVKELWRSVSIWRSYGNSFWLTVYSTVTTRGKVLSWEYRSPQKRNSRPPASIILCWVSWECITYLLCVSDLLVCLHWKKSPVYGVFGQ